MNSIFLTLKLFCLLNVIAFNCLSETHCTGPSFLLKHRDHDRTLIGKIIKKAALNQNSINMTFNPACSRVWTNSRMSYVNDFAW